MFNIRQAMKHTRWVKARAGRRVLHRHGLCLPSESAMSLLSHQQSNFPLSLPLLRSFTLSHLLVLCLSNGILKCSRRSPSETFLLFRTIGGHTSALASRGQLTRLDYHEMLLIASRQRHEDADISRRHGLAA